jgi:hypothetical protein
MTVFPFPSSFPPAILLSHILYCYHQPLYRALHIIQQRTRRRLRQLPLRDLPRQTDHLPLSSSLCQDQRTWKSVLARPKSVSSLFSCRAIILIPSSCGQHHHSICHSSQVAKILQTRLHARNPTHAGTTCSKGWTTRTSSRRC